MCRGEICHNTDVTLLQAYTHVWALASECERFAGSFRVECNAQLKVVREGIALVKQSTAFAGAMSVVWE